MLNIVDYIDSDDESSPKSSTKTRKNVQKPQETQNTAQANVGLQPPSSVSWQECYDENSGYAYYWNIHNGEVTWDEPDELKQHKLELEKYYKLVEANRRGLAVAAAAVLLKQKQKQQQQIRDKDKLPPDKKHKEEKDVESEEDERIEMITSYGNDTVSDSESESEKVIDPPQAKKSKLSNDHQDIKKTKKNAKSSDVIFGPELPAMNYNMSLPPNHINSDKAQISDPIIEDNDSEENALTKIMAEETHSDSEGSTHEDDTKTDEQIIAELRQKALLLKKLGGEMPAELKLILDADELNGASEESNAIQLLSGYGNESDNEESLKNEKTKGASPSLLNKLPKKSSLTTVRNFKKLKLSARGKALIEASITTQRARAAKLEPPPEEVDDIDDSKAGFGFQASKSDSSSTVVKKTEVSFVKESMNNEAEVKTVEKDKEDNLDGCKVGDFSSVLKSKLSYLSTQEKKEATTLQKTKIQLETLYLAWKEGALSEKYLMSVCIDVSQRLKKLEQENLPFGWVALWDITQSKYYYLNEKENLKQYYFPESAADGEEDMDLSTTPPHSPAMNNTNVGSYDRPVLPRVPDAKECLPPIPGIEDYNSESPPPLPPPPQSSPPPLPPPPPSSPPPLPPPPPSHSPPPKPPPPPSYSPKPPLPPPCYNPKPSSPSLKPKNLPQNYDPPPPPNYTPTPPPPPNYNPPLPSNYNPIPPPLNFKPTPSPPNYNTPPAPPPPNYNTSCSYNMEPSHPPSYSIEAPPPPSITYVSSPSPVPPPAGPQVNKLLSELDSFYSDIASMTSPPPVAQYSKPTSSKTEKTVDPGPGSPPQLAAPATAPTKKKKKLTKVAPVLSMKKKNVSSLVAKWQQAQQNL